MIPKRVSHEYSLKMPLEIERKFLVTHTHWRSEALGLYCCQGYLSQRSDITVRVRTLGEKAFLTIKKRQEPTQRISRLEFEYEIPFHEAQELQKLCKIPLIEKTRYRLHYGGKMWDIDQFHGRNEGLLMAEVELNDPKEAIELPSWVGEEVSDDSRYYNSNLALHPFEEWKGS